MSLQDKPSLYTVKASDIPFGYHFVITRPDNSVIKRVGESKELYSDHRRYRRFR